jgi:hypothetical protein
MCNVNVTMCTMYGVNIVMCTMYGVYIMIQYVGIAVGNLCYMK